MRAVYADNTIIDDIVALQAYALLTALRLHVHDSIIVDSKVDLIANDLGEAQGRSFIKTHDKYTGGCASYVSKDEVEGAEKVSRVQDFQACKSGKAADGKSIEKVSNPYRGY